MSRIASAPFRFRILVLIAVLSVWPRIVGASTCKPEGQGCRTNQSCCSRVCVNSAPPGKRPFGTCCTPTTCSAKGANCGWIDDGTCPDKLFCGDCTAPDTCSGGGAPNVCGCTPTMCSATDCGTIPDGCGGTLDCGVCDVCSGVVLTTCVPGSVNPTGCPCAGTTQCTAGNVCPLAPGSSSGVCTAIDGTPGNPVCVPGNTSGLSATCCPCGGTVNCALGNVCPLAPGCTSGVCTSIDCTPTTCAAEGADSGTIPDGCGGTLDCACVGVVLTTCVPGSVNPTGCPCAGTTQCTAGNVCPLAPGSSSGVCTAIDGTPGNPVCIPGNTSGLSATCCPCAGTVNCALGNVCPLAPGCTSGVCTAIGD